MFQCFFSVQVALHFVKDEKTRFGLALECGNIEVKLVFVSVQIKIELNRCTKFIVELRWPEGPPSGAP